MSIYKFYPCKPLTLVRTLISEKICVLRDDNNTNNGDGMDAYDPGFWGRKRKRSLELRGKELDLTELLAGS